MMRYPKLKQRPPHFRVNPAWHPFKQGAVLLGLGNHPGSVRFEDSSAWKNTGKLTNMSPPDDWKWVPELGRWALDFDGLDDYVDLLENQKGGHPFVNLGNNNNYTISAWINTTAGGAAGIGWRGDDTIIELRERGTGVRKPFWFGVESDVLCLGREDDVSNEREIGAIAVNDGSWHQVIGVVQDDSVDFFVDGSFDVTRTYTDATGDASVGNNSADMGIGVRAKNDGTQDAELFAGLITDPLIFNHILTPSEIADLADPSNVDLRVGNLPCLLPPRRMVFPAAVAPAGEVTASGTDGAVAADSATARVIARATAMDGAVAGDSPEVRGTLQAASTDGATAMDAGTVERLVQAAATDGAVAGDAPGLDATLRAAGTDGATAIDAGVVRALLRAAAVDGAVAYDAGIGTVPGVGAVTAGVRLEPTYQASVEIKP